MVKVSDFEIKFWKDWLYADTLKRQDMVKNLPITKQVWKMDKLPRKEYHFASALNGYFEDLENAVYTKIKLEEDKKKLRR